MTATTHANGHAPAAPKPVARATRPNVRSQKSGDKEYAQTQEWGNVYEAAAYEEQIRADADAIWVDHGSPNLTRGLFVRLYPLLRLPIHPGHIIATSRATGKPYESDGVRSVQVLVDRMNNVLTPMWWRVTRQYESGSTECLATVRVFDFQGNVLAEGESWGGMERANTKGNLRKASYTNAAKIAFAAIGPAHEIYTQAIDYDPDLLPGAIDDQNTAPAVREAVAAAPAARPEVLEPPERTIERLLAIEDDLAPLRKHAHDGMEKAGAGLDQRARQLDEASKHGKAGLDELAARINNFLDAS